MRKLKTFFSTLAIGIMFSVTVVTAQTYNFSLMTENVTNTSYVRKMEIVHMLG